MPVFVGTFDDGRPLIGVFNKDYRNFPDTKSFPWLLELNIQLRDVRDDGLPQSDETAIVNDFEKSIITTLSEATKVLFVAHVTGGDSRRVYCYVAAPFPAHAILTKLCDNPQTREFEFRIVEDENWSAVAHFWTQGGARTFGAVLQAFKRRFRRKPGPK